MNRLSVWAIAATLVAIGGCGSVNINLWPFGEREAALTATGPRGPENAVEYRCEGNRKFHVRWLDGDKAAWVFFPERQVRLDRQGGEGVRYGNGIAVLSIQGGEATLNDGPANAYTGCKAAAGK